jgi:hypothetical protein
MIIRNHRFGIFYLIDESITGLRPCFPSQFWKNYKIGPEFKGVTKLVLNSKGGGEECGTPILSNNSPFKIDTKQLDFD